MKFSLSPSVTLVPGHNATFAITGLSCYHRRAFANNSSKDLYATDTLAPLCTDSHPNTIVKRRTSPLRSTKLYIRDYIYRFARLPVFKRCSCNTSARRQHQRRGGLIALCRKPRLQRRLSRNAAYKRKHGRRERPDRCLYKITSVYL